MGNIPNTTTNGLVLQSVGNGSNDSQWAVLNTGGGSTLPSGTALGQQIQYNGTGWVVTSVTGLTTGQSLIWSGSAWVPGTPSSNATQLQGHAINGFTSPSSGSVLYYYGASTNQWLYSGAPTPGTTGGILYWNGSNYVPTVTPGGSGVLNWTGSAYNYISVGASTPNNDAWSNLTTTTRNVTTTVPSTTWDVTVSGVNATSTFTKFLITWSAHQQSTSNNSSGLVPYIYDTTNSAVIFSQSIGTFANTERGMLSGTVVYTDTSGPRPMSVSLGFYWTTTGTTGQIGFANMSIVGIE